MRTSRSKKKLLYIVSDVGKSLQFEWVAPPLSGHYDLTFVLVSQKNTPLEKFLRSAQIKVIVVDKSGFAGLWFRIFQIIARERPDIVHAHLWRATLTAMSVSWLLRVKQRIFTRHHGSMHYTIYPGGQKWDRLCNMLATDIVAISDNVRKILVEKDGAKVSKISLIHHGFDLRYFETPDIIKTQEIISKNKIPADSLKIGVISRYSRLKGLEYVIRAFRETRRSNPRAHLILANAHGDYASYIRQQLHELPVGSYTEILFEENLSALYHLFDIFIHVPESADFEAFGQVYIEALAAGVPSIFTLSGVAPEFIKDQYNALVVDFCNAGSIATAISRLATEPNIAKQLVAGGKESVEQFALQNMLSKLRLLYD